MRSPIFAGKSRSKAGDNVAVFRDSWMSASALSDRNDADIMPLCREIGLPIRTREDFDRPILVSLCRINRKL
jgi:hypothetical protein